MYVLLVLSAILAAHFRVRRDRIALAGHYFRLSVLLVHIVRRSAPILFHVRKGHIPTISVLSASFFASLVQMALSVLLDRQNTIAKVSRKENSPQQLLFLSLAY